MDVTEEILNQHIIYGASDNTAPAGLSTSRSLHYAPGPSITRPENVTVALLPYTLKYQDSVGLFGAENHFVKVTVKTDTAFVARCFEEDFWECAQISAEDTVVNTYTSAVVDFEKDLDTVNTYEPATMRFGLPERIDPFVSVDLNNLKTGNTYVDSWLDVRLYTRDREEHPYDKMFVRKNDVFYIGFHARNTRRLPYNVNCVIGDKFLNGNELTDEQRLYLQHKRFS